MGELSPGLGIHRLGWIAVVLAAAALTVAVAQPRAQAEAPCAIGIQPRLRMAPVMPRAFDPQGHQQVGADCIAWQQFIALNWRADPARPGVASDVPASAFGAPADASPTVWESFVDAATLFDPASARAAAPLPGTSFVLDRVQQAGTGWLTSKAGDVTYYQVKLNRDEAEYIVRNGLTTAKGQAACVAGRGGLNLPHGGGDATIATGLDTDCAGERRRYGANIGAIEIKAAWVALPADGSLDYRYETARATLVDPSSGARRRATVGLVGLHIVHKVPGAAQFIWATFEQVDNAPDEPGTTGGAAPALATRPLPRRGYTYFDAACAAAGGPFGCAHDLRPRGACGKVLEPGCRPYSVPTQTTRLTPVQKEADRATADAWNAIRAARPPGSPESVFEYYRLVDVQWPSQDVPSVPPRATIPLPTGVITPADSTRHVANTTMETYVQATDSCMDCHRNAPIAQAVGRRPASRREQRLVRALVGSASDSAAARPPASDYSFLFAVETRR